MSEIFISYARSQEREAQRIAEALRTLGYDVWRDDQIPPHRAYADEISERLETSKAVVVIWSAEAAKSEWVRSEAESARAGKKLIQVTVDGAKLPMPFDQIQCADLIGWTGGTDATNWRKVVNSVAELAAAAPSPIDVPKRTLGKIGGQRLAILGGLAAVLIAAAAAILLVRGLGASRAAPWSDQDPRMTFVLGPADVPAGDPILASYADQFIRALKARFTPAFGDSRLLTDDTGGGTIARYSIGAEFQHNGSSVVTRVTLRERANGAVLGIREVTDPRGPAVSLPAVWQASALIKTTALRHEAALSAAKPAKALDAHDFLLMALSAPEGRSSNARAIHWLEQAARLAPDRPFIADSLATMLEARVRHGWSADRAADISRVGAMAERLARDNPDEFVAQQLLSDSYLLQGRWQDAKVAASRLLALKPDDAAGSLTKARALFNLGDFQGAQLLVDGVKSFQNSKDELDTAELQGLLRFHEQRYGEAAAELRRAVQLTPEEDRGHPAFAGLRLFLAAAEAWDGRLQDARADLADFQAATPGVHDLFEFRAWNDAKSLPLTDWDRLAAGLTKIGWGEAAHRTAST